MKKRPAPAARSIPLDSLLTKKQKKALPNAADANVSHQLVQVEKELLECKLNLKVLEERLRLIEKAFEQLLKTQMGVLEVVLRVALETGVDYDSLEDIISSTRIIKQSQYVNT